MSNLQALRSFRIVCPSGQVHLVEELLEAQGYRFIPEPFSPWARRLVEEPKPLGGSLAAFFGLIYIQDRSSMLPPVALAPAEGSAVLDMCASPGSKTGFLAQLVGGGGFVLGNEPNRSRLATLRQNLFTLNLLHAATCSYPGESLPLPDGSWDNIQLDPPCSGWGTVERNPQVLKLWQGDKIRPLIALQRQLLAEAARLLRPGGRVVYSTCTTNVDENEAQVRFAIETLGLEPDPLEPPPGFVFAAPELPGCEGVLRVDPQGSGAQGFFVAAFRRPSSGVAPLAVPVAPLKATPLHADELALPGVRPDLLPEGQVSIFGDTAHFLPRQALERLPASFRWQGCAIGKANKNGLRLLPRLRSLMPTPEEAPGTCAIPLDIDELESIAALLSGRSLMLPDVKEGREACLYWRGLPLCRLRIKPGSAGNGKTGGRALWSER